MESNQPNGDRKGIFLVSGAAALIGGLFCMTPVVLVLLGFSYEKRGEFWERVKTGS